MTVATSAPFDAVVIGAGPAGCSAASWAVQMGLRVAVVDRATEPCASLAALDFAQDWVLGQPQATLRAVGQQLAAHVRQWKGIAWHLGRPVAGLARADGGWQVHLADGTVLPARALVVATGVRPVRPALYFGTGAEVLDAVTLTARRASLPAGRTLLMGGGDNALENADYLARQGHQVTLWSRDDYRGRPAHIAALDAHTSLVQRHRMPLPTALRPGAAGGVEVESAAFGREHFDAVAVLFGYEPEPAPWAWLAEALPGHAPLAPGRAAPELGVFVAGDANGRWHPCVQSALADGVAAAQQVLAFVQPSPESAARAASVHRLSTLNSQVLQLSGLRFGANLGVLAHERDGPQPIQVDAELNLGAQPALARDAELAHVLDYRKVRQIIIDECTAEHTDLLESLLAKLCVRLMRLPGVLGVRIRVAKLEIFEDCEVAIRCEAGTW